MRGREIERQVGVRVLNFQMFDMVNLNVRFV
jgi:hypothetical protein